MLRFRYTPVSLHTPSPALGGASVRHVPLLLVRTTGLVGPVARHFRIDSGADDTILPLSMAAALGLDLTNAPTGEAESAAGTTVRYPIARVTFGISDGVKFCTWDALVGFVNTPRRTGLAGLAGFLNYFDVELFGDGHEFTLAPNAAFPGQHGTH